MKNEKNITIKDVALLAGVSIGTVDRALNDRGRISDKTKAKVLQAAKELNYHRNEFASAIRRSVKTKILVINARNPEFYMQYFTRGFEEQAKEYEGYGLEINMAYSKTLGISDMLEITKEINAKEYDGVLINAGGSELSDFIDNSIKLGVPVATFNCDAPESKRVFYSGENHYMSGRLSGELTAKFMKKKGTIALFIGNESVLSLRERIQGFKDVIKEEYPEIDIVKIISNEDNLSIVDERAQDLFRDGIPDAVFCNSATGALPICKIIENMSQKIRPLVVGYDEGPELVEMLNKGICTAIIYEEPERQAKKALSYMFDGIYNQMPWPSEKDSLIMPSIVLKENSAVYFKHFLQK